MAIGCGGVAGGETFERSPGWALGVTRYGLVGSGDNLMSNLFGLDSQRNGTNFIGNPFRQV
jgi:hypothetical protein